MNAKAIAGIVLAAGFLTLFAAAVLPSTLQWPAIVPSATGVGVQLWEVRTFEVLLQAFIMLGGVVAILLLLGSQRRREAST
ncbi:MAG TPA: hypothetical protein VIB49_05560 [Thermoplasmata archaeon]|jgi:uncharacterized membrane protein